jgi:aspartate carbamoyltransferase catalytic subunit
MMVASAIKTCPSYTTDSTTSATTTDSEHHDHENIMNGVGGTMYCMDDAVDHYMDTAMVDTAMANTPTSTTTVTTPSNTKIVVNGVTLPVLTHDPASWYLASLLTVQQVTPSGLQYLLQLSHRMQLQQQQQQQSQHPYERLQLPQFILGTLFYEASTRTSCSFQTAALKLGGNYIHVDGQGNTSTCKKGETLYDTVQCIQSYTDCTILRHPDTGSIYTLFPSTAKGGGANNAAPVVTLPLSKPIINAGDGTGEHPTQALLDVYTIYIEYILKYCQTGPTSTSTTSFSSSPSSPSVQVPKTFIIVVLGDLKNGRTVHSFVKLLYQNTTHNVLYTDQLIIRCCAPNPTLQLPKDVVVQQGSTSSTSKVRLEYYQDPIEACTDAHVVYVTRIQKERFVNDEEYNAVKVRKKVSCFATLILGTIDLPFQRCYSCF